MPLEGEAARKTYVNHREIADSVWITRHEILGEECIQKTYPAAGREDSIAFAEPRLLNELDHPHITPIREAQFDPSRPGHVTMVMPVYRGSSVHAAMAVEDHRFSVASVIAVVADVASALSYLHTTKRYIHRDVKPKNVLLDEARKVGYLADFGSAALLDSTGTAPAIVATQLYQPPEVGRTGRIGPKADVYGLALTAFEMLNGLFPYAELDPAEIDRRVNKGLRALPENALGVPTFAPHVPDAVIRLVRQAINTDPAKRPSAADLLRELKALKCVDWRHVEGEGIEGLWGGRWPPRRRPDKQMELRITSAILRAGPSRNKRRLAADYSSATSGGWRGVGVPEATVDAHDDAAVSAFFSAVDAHVAKRWPA